MTAPAAALTFSFGDLAIGASSSTPNDLEWLREFLEPDFEVRDGGTVDCRVVVDANAERWNELLALAVEPSAPMLDCFALDSSVVRLPIVRRDGTKTIVRDGLFDAEYVIEPDSRSVTIVTSPANRRVRASLLRVVREFAMNHLHGRGLLLHASAVALGERGVMIAGHKAAGKTTLLTYLLSNRIGKYLSNDRVLVSDLGGEQMLRNVPTVISVRPGTLEFCSGFRERFVHSGFTSYLLTLAEAAGERDAPIQPNQFGNYFLSPIQFRTVLDAEQRHVCAARVLVFPVITPEIETFAIRELSRAEAMERIPEAFLGAGGWRKGTEAFAIPSEHPTPDESDLAERALKLISSVRVYECRLGPGAYRDASLAESIASLSSSV